MYKSNPYKRSVLKTVTLNELNAMSERLPSFVINYRRPLASNHPKVVTKVTSNEERRLRRFFKCTKFNLRSGHKSDQCFACKNFRTKFEEHLNKKHPKQTFYCCYCHSRLNDDNKKKLMESERLINHMIVVHRHRRFQCNLCLYRSIGAEQVNIHQSLIHSDIYKSTLQRKQLNGKMCRILECPPATADSCRKPLLTPTEMYKFHKSPRLNADGNHSKDYQCVYCDYMGDTNNKVAEHCVQTHPDFHILYYVPDPLVTSTQTPVRPQHYTDIDVFNPIKEPETQDNRVTSTGQEAINKYIKNKKECEKNVEEFAFKKKERVSAVQSRTSASTSGLSRKSLNQDKYSSPTNAPRRGVSFGSQRSIGFYKLGSTKSSVKKTDFSKLGLPRPSLPKPGLPKSTHYPKKGFQRSSAAATSNGRFSQSFSRPKYTTKSVKVNSFKRKPLSDGPLNYERKTSYESDDSLSSVAETVFKDNSSDGLNQPSTSFKTTTIEVAEPDSDEEERHHFFCLFCDRTYAESEEAVDHLETHLPEITEAIDDIEVTKSAKSWLKKFIEKQMNSFEEDNEVDDSGHHYQCPICVKIARIRQLKAKRFRTSWELRSHFWDHTLWTPVKCLICKTENFMPNCDHLIVKHLNSKHSEQLMDSESHPINTLLGNKVKGHFTPEQREALHEYKFIETNNYKPLDSKIEAILKQISDEREAQLREEAEKVHKMSIVLPKLVIHLLPALNFDDDDMITDYIESIDGLNTNTPKRRKTNTESEEKKPFEEVIDIGSSSLEDSSDEEDAKNKWSNREEEPKAKKQNTVRKRRRLQLLSDDSDEEEEKIKETESVVPTASSPTITPVRRYMCSLCSDLFNNRNEVMAHCEEVHPGEPIGFTRPNID